MGSTSCHVSNHTWRPKDTNIAKCLERSEGDESCGAMAGHVGFMEGTVFICVNSEKWVLSYFVTILSLLPISSAASSTPAVNIQPDVSGGWDWHTKPGKSQQVIFVRI